MIRFFFGLCCVIFFCLYDEIGCLLVVGIYWVYGVLEIWCCEGCEVDDGGLEEDVVELVVFFGWLLCCFIWVGYVFGCEFWGFLWDLCFILRLCYGEGCVLLIYVSRWIYCFVW